MPCSSWRLATSGGYLLRRRLRGLISCSASSCSSELPKTFAQRATSSGTMRFTPHFGRPRQGPRCQVVELLASRAARPTAPAVAIATSAANDVSPRLDALPSPQRALWPELAAVPRRYVLYSSTAFTLRLAHRPSVDFDSFAHDHLDHHELTAVPFVRDAAVLDEGSDTRTILTTHTGGDVKVSFFGG